MLDLDDSKKKNTKLSRMDIWKRHDVLKEDPKDLDKKSNQITSKGQITGGQIPNDTT